MEELVFACTLRPVLEWGGDYGEEEPTERYGRYHNSNFRIPGFGRNACVVAAHIIGDIDKYLSEGHSEQTIVDACMKELNKPPRKRARKPRFGDKLSVHKYKFLKDKKGDTYIGVALITTKKRNKNFWGTGQKLYTSA